MNDPIVFPDLALARRPELFDRIRAIGSDPGPCRRAAFGGTPGWLISEMPAARLLLTSSAGVKSRPARSQRLLGGVGVLRSDQVRGVKRELVAAMGAEARQLCRVRQHLLATVPDSPPLNGPLTEALSSATLSQVTGQPPGSVDGAVVRRLVVATWSDLEEGTGSAQRDDELAAFVADLVRGSDSAFLARLRGAGWSTDRICEELRAMILAGWGSTTAAVLSTLALRAAPLRSTATLDEVLRLYPPSFMIARRIAEAGPAGLPFAVGDLVVVSPWLVQRNPHGWAEPERFVPGRRPLHQARWFLPFGLGPRRCPAAAFARAQIDAAVAIYSERPELPSGSVLTMVESRSPALVPTYQDPLISTRRDA